MSDPVLDPIAAAEARGYAKAITELREEGQRALERWSVAGSVTGEWDAYDAAADYLEFVRASEAAEDGA